MAQVNEISFNSSGPPSGIGAREKVNSPLEPPTNETEEVQNEERVQRQSAASAERLGQQEERAAVSKEAEVREKSVRTERRREQIVDDVTENQEQAPNPSGALGGLAESRPSETSSEGINASPTEVSRSQSAQARPEGGAEQVSRQAPGARADEVRNKRANEVSQDKLRSFETRNQERVGGGSNAEISESVTRQREEANVSDKPAFDVPEQKIDQVRSTGMEHAPEPVRDSAQGRESAPPERPSDPQAERGLNIDKLI